MRILLEFVRTLVFFLLFIMDTYHLVTTKVSVEPLKYISLRDLDLIILTCEDLWVTMHGGLTSIILRHANLPRLLPEI